MTFFSRYKLNTLGIIVSVALCWLTGWQGHAADDSSVQNCEACHPAITKEWRASAHAKAMGPEFIVIWDQYNKKIECLVCHTSHYDRKTGEYSKEGIACESCHGVLQENHPGEKKMILPVTSETCQSCHSMTYGEWKISAHGQKNIRCFDCHKMHDMAPRKEDPDQNCGTCHPARLRDFAHATHHIKGLYCTTCHMPKPISIKQAQIRGTGAPGHTFGVGAHVCSNCHREMVHQGHDVVSLQKEVETLKAQGVDEMAERVKELESTSSEQKTLVDSTKRVLPWVVLIVYALGVFSGLALSWYRRKLKK